MNVNSTKSHGPKTSEAAKSEGARQETRARREAENLAARGKRDFASVLRDVAQASGRAGLDERGETAGGGEAAAAENSPELDVCREETREDARPEVVAPGPHGVAAEAARPVEEAGASAVLHRADLEKIVAAVRTQMVDGRRVLTLELNRSVLEGLRVKLSMDSAGMITAEFIVSGEGLRAVLEGRSRELAEQLRSRGVNLAALTTTAGAQSPAGQGGADSSGHGGARGGGDSYSSPTLDVTVAQLSVADARADSFDADGGQDDPAARAIRYRA